MININDYIENNKPVKNKKSSNNYNNAYKSHIEQTIAKSSNIITALESVGAMYGIPASNIISDDTAHAISVQNDTIIAPPLPNPEKYTKPIMQSISGALDFISQRIDDKLDDYQMNNIKQGRIDDAIANANPNKGKCIGRYEDEEGGEILAYDTGLVDMPNTEAGRRKVEELRADGTIPSIEWRDGTMQRKQEPEYFSDEDDVTDNVDMNASSDISASDSEINSMTNDVSSTINESAYHLRMISKMNNTTHLGYDLLQKHGFDYVKPVDSIVMEADKSAAKEKEKEKEAKVILPKDMKHLKFDNTGILNAVKYFNKARMEQSNISDGNIDLTKFINSPNYEKAIDSLNKQFDCRINLRFDGKNNYANAGTFILDDLKKKLTVSKSKGFQLGGLPIDIMVYGHYFEMSAPKDQELFGQSMVSTICHEIFHNIAGVFRYESIRSSMSLAATMNLAAGAKSMKERRIIITNYVDTLENLSSKNIFTVIAKKNIIKDLMAISILYNKENNKSNKNKKDNKNDSKTKKDDKRKRDAEKYTTALIRRYKSLTRSWKFGTSTILHSSILGVDIYVSYIFLMELITSTGNIFTLSLSLFMWVCSLQQMATVIQLLSSKHKYKTENYYEEYYCDLFAGMYKLPKVFFIGTSDKKYTPNDVDRDKLNELAKVEKELFEAAQYHYPSDIERTHTGVKIAKTLLKDKTIDESTKKYCEWIVDNFSKVSETDVETIYNKTTFDPKEADDLDQHLQDLIEDNNIVLTESYLFKNNGV